MKKAIMALRVFLTLASSSYAGTISLENGNISFAAPDGFARLPEETIRIKVIAHRDNSNVP
ncbi:MAG: hypothetical protein AB1733_18175 [Thermodesulfobacteriota bacterium]